MEYLSDEVFTIEARKCKRCGRLLTSHEAIMKGMGCRCQEKAQREARAYEPIPGQMDIYDYLGGKANDGSES